MSKIPASEAEKVPSQTHVKEVRAEFDARAETYSDLFSDANKTGASVLFRLRAKIVASMLAQSTGSLLDCACGSGEVTEDVIKAASFQKVWVNDISGEMLRRAQSRLAAHQSKQEFFWLNSDVFALNPDDMHSRFDVILCLGLIAHSGRLDELLALFRGMLHDNGSVILQSSLLDHPGSRLIKLVTDRRHAAGAKYKFSFYTFDQIAKAARNSGFEVEENRRFGLCIPFGDRLLGRANYFLERTFASAMRSFGGEAILRLRKASR